VLSFFNAPAEDYVCIFTSNCTSALKLVGESFPFDPTSHFVLAEDSHNSVNGIRKFAESKGAIVHYVPSRLGGGFDELDLLVRFFPSIPAFHA
jgi:selenocysteine lyase/cysteine desulfurase